jgi:four helix bundle protein
MWDGRLKMDGIKHFFSLIVLLFLKWLIKKKRENMGYHNLEIYRLARELVREIHQMTLTNLPDFEKYETGAQIRRSAKSIKSNIVEGYGRRSHKKDFIHFLIIAYSSAQETIDHLDTLKDTGSMKNHEEYRPFTNKQICLLESSIVS